VLPGQAARLCGLLDTPGQGHRALAEAQCHHEHLVTVRQPALVEAHLDAAQRRRPRQHLAREQCHHRVTVEVRVGQHAHAPLITLH
jgi:hypothetical protein